MLSTGASPRFHNPRWDAAGSQASAVELARRSGVLVENPIRPGPRGHAHARVQVGPSQTRLVASRSHRHFFPVYYPTYYYPYPYYGYYPYSYYYGYGGYGYPGRDVVRGCCYDEDTGTLRCDDPSIDGSPAYAEQVNWYQGRRIAFVSSPVFGTQRWAWLCTVRQDRESNPLPNTHRRESRLLRYANRCANQGVDAAVEETGAPPLEAEIPAQAGQVPTEAPVPHAEPWPGLHCIGHPEIPNLVCCSRTGFYGKHDYYCVTVPQPVG